MTDARPHHLYVVEDDVALRDMLATYLERQGMAVTAMASAEELLKRMDRLRPDLVVLDINLPGLSGLQACQQLRAQGDRLPIILLTAQSDEIDRVLGLEMGADDYLGKPFSPRELLARIKALLRRVSFAQERGSDVLAFDEWRLDMISHRLFHADGEEVFLSGADFALLKLFLDHPQQILDRDTIANATRGREVMPLERIVDMAVSRLRQRLRDTGKSPRLIRTVRGSGYLLATQVTPHHESAH